MLTVDYESQMSPSEVDLYLFHEGTLYEGYKVFGAHSEQYNGKKGFRFTVWAPHARSVSVVGDFNDWDTDANRLSLVENSGVWTGFIADLGNEERYKYAIETPTGSIVLKADPYAFYAEKRPNTASLTCSSLHSYAWHDKRWMRQRAKRDQYHRPMNIYECHLGSWRKTDTNHLMTYRQLADELVEYVAQNGFTHIELMPIMEHPYDRSWGYQITGYFAPTSRFGSPEDFMYFVDTCHQNSIGVILDWTPAHFCRDMHGLGKFDGTPLYEPCDPKLADRPQWGTYNFDFSKNEVISFLISNARFWMDIYHVEGFRIDAVSSMIYLNHNGDMPFELKNKYGGDEHLEAIDFIKKLNEAVFLKCPEALMIAEEATDYPMVTKPTDQGGLGFNYKWNMGWVHDILRYMSYEPSERCVHHNLITFSMLYAYSENFVLALSHDELVYGKRSLLNKMKGDEWQRFANLRVLFGFFMTHPGKKLLFMGSEFAQFDEWKDLEQLDWNLLDFSKHRSFQQYVMAFNHFYRSVSCLWRLDHELDGFQWIDADNAEQSIISFIRKGKRKGDYCIVVCNFTPAVYHQFKLGVPAVGSYIEVFNSDAAAFGGSGQCNHQPIIVEEAPFHNQPYHIKLTIPPLGIIILMKETKKRKIMTAYEQV
ncbi:1,4-alpha-glucan branching protein GlgB [Sporolactobacillus inulinus]|uniref:1,4-alpha-glucan branching enzyme GlgB n=1 Tax=Sporolactobacillus inulinus CASD TaxID=1069536 RepID=A0A0U1QLM9_9BACL|nr:1,4-alpha-glucan branching protein GlgB [Sporolactobacillus inulinus]KLI01671.1 1,4-alpha-glucan branching protein [Sporolactobacillus inulinus CASD]GEB76134.1 1,4-alpha-glucan branching enzyme GlgB [Sporolactobacillus inulinus]